MLISVYLSISGTKLGGLFNFIGLYKLDDLGAIDILRLVGVDPLIYAAVFSLYIISNKVYAKWISRLTKKKSAIGLSVQRGRQRSSSEGEPSNSEREETSFKTHHTTSSVSEQSIVRAARKLALFRQRRQKALETIRYAAEVVLLTILFACGILKTSLISAFYLVSFLTIMTIVSCDVQFYTFYNLFKLTLCSTSLCHLIVLFLYQLTWFRDVLSPHSLDAR